ncbi:MAG: hypothetical protein V3W41_01245 [Planctomycetota bacterium]
MFEVKPESRSGSARASWLQWSRDLQRGRPQERVRALRNITLSLVQSLSVSTVLRVLGDPWHRVPPRTTEPGGVRREVLTWRHPTESRTHVQVLFKNGRLDALHVVVDAGACLAPRIFGVQEYWEEGDRKSDCEFELAAS